MGKFNGSIVMIQHFPTLGNYIVHREGSGVEVYSSDDEIQDTYIHRYMRECLSDKLYHESMICTSLIKGNSPMLKQIIYCKSFESEDAPHGRTTINSNINWVLWTPNTSELTVNRGVLGASKVARITDLSEAPQDVRDFMEGCTDGQHIALSQHYVDHNRVDGGVEMVEVSEYFFSVGKVIYGFQRERVALITPEEMESLGLQHM